jgi:phosphatidate cytidylyltransferase
MIRQRLILILVFLPLIFGLVYVGQWPYTLALAFAFTMAALEYGKLFQHQGNRPSLPLMLLAAGGLPIVRYLAGFEYAPAFITGILMIAMAWHLVDYERGAPRSGTDFAHTFTGSLYIGWLGSYLISIRQLIDGAWWVFLVLSTVWITDISAYVIGSSFGKHPMTQRLSPKKTWEGYAGGVVFGTGAALVLAAAIGRLAAPASSFTPVSALLVAGAVSILTPLGDLGISMIKRELKVKDTGTLLLGHGGFLDRMDSWLWAAALGYYTLQVLS